MAKQPKPQAAAPGVAATHPTVVVPAAIYALLEQGKTFSVFVPLGTYTEATRPTEIAVLPKGNAEAEPLRLQCTSMDEVGNHYQPQGYPEQYKAYGKCLRLRVKLYTSQPVPAKETPTEAPAGEVAGDTNEE